MRNRSVREELIRVVKTCGETPVAAATRLRVPVSTAYRWLRAARTAGRELAPPQALTFIELAPPLRSETLVVRVGVAELEVRPGFDAAHLRAVVAALAEVGR